MLMEFRYLIYKHQRRIHDWFKMYGIMLSIDQRTLVWYFNAWSFCLFVFCCCCFSNRWSTQLFWSKRFLWSLLCSIKCVLTVRERRPITFGKLSCKCDKRWWYQTRQQTDRQAEMQLNTHCTLWYDRWTFFLRHPTRKRFSIWSS